MTARMLALATAPRKDSRHWEQSETSWEDVCGWAAQPQRQRECGGYLLGELQETVVVHPGSSDECFGRHRNKAAVVWRDVLALDADHALASLPDAVEMMFGAALVHTTFSHRPEAPRYRLLFPLSRRVTPAEYAHLARVVMHQLGEEQFDRTCDQAERFMFRPATADPGSYFHRAQSGAWLNVDAMLSLYDPGKHGTPTQYEAVEKQDPCEVPGIVGAFNRAYDIDDAISAFGLPYETAGDGRWHLAGAKSPAGLVLVSAGVVYSHHANDPACGQACSAFDLVRLHRFGDLDADARPGTPVADLPSHAAMAKLATEDEWVGAELAKEVGADFSGPAPADDDAVPLDRVTVWLADASEWARQAVGRGRLSDVFRRGAVLVSVAREGEEGYIPPADDHDSNGPSQVVRLSPDGLHARMVYRHVFLNQRGNTVVLPRQAATHAVAAAELLPNVRVLVGVTDFPLVRSDGSLLSVPGYDAASGLYYLPRGEAPDVPDEPTAEDVQSARAALEYVVRDFPFRTDDDRANWLGMALTPAVRLLVDGNSKGCIIDAPDAGSGKSLLAEVLLELYGGVMRGSWPHDEAEVGKEIATIFDTTNSPVVVFDNVRGNLKSAKVENLLTAREFSERRLGSTTQVVGRNDRLWVWTANNLSIGGDLGRRIMRVSIDANMPQPHLRPASGFAEPRLREYVRDHRSELLGAVLTLVRAWVLRSGAADAPNDSADGFASWRAVVSGVLRNAGVAGEFDAESTRVQTVSEEDEEWAVFLEALHAKFGDKPWKASQAAGANLDDEAWPEELLGRKYYEGFAKTLGRWLGYRDGRWAGDLCVRTRRRVQAMAWPASWQASGHSNTSTLSLTDLGGERRGQGFRVPSRQEATSELPDCRLQVGLLLVQVDAEAVQLVHERPGV